MSSTPVPKKIKVRIALVIDPSGQWNACGWGGPKSNAGDGEKMGLAVDGVGDGDARYWVEAEIDLPIGAISIDGVVVRE